MYKLLGATQLISKLGYLWRFIIFKLIHRNIRTKGFVKIGRRVNLKVSGNCSFGVGCVLKHDVTIFVSKGAKLKFGNNVNIGHHNEISCFNDIKIGDNSFTAAYVYLGDYSHSFTDSEIPIYMQKLKLGEIEIGNNVWIGRGAVILKGSLISENSVIGANCTISNLIEKDKIAVVGRPTIIEKKN